MKTMMNDPNLKIFLSYCFDILHAYQKSVDKRILKSAVCLAVGFSRRFQRKMNKKSRQKHKIAKPTNSFINNFFVPSRIYVDISAAKLWFHFVLYKTRTETKQSGKTTANGICSFHRSNGAVCIQRCTHSLNVSVHCFLSFVLRSVVFIIIVRLVLRFDCCGQTLTNYWFHSALALRSRAFNHFAFAWKCAPAFE